jgi:hypothetical protein
MRRLVFVLLLLLAASLIDSPLVWVLIVSACAIVAIAEVAHQWEKRQMSRSGSP